MHKITGSLFAKINIFAAGNMASTVNTEKEILYQHLESFFDKYGRTGASRDIHHAYKSARRSGSHETYMLLLGKLAQSPFKPGFIVESVPVGNSFTYKVHFLTENNQIVGKSAVPTSEETASSDAGKREHHIDKIDKKVSRCVTKIKVHDDTIERLLEDMYRVKDLVMVAAKRESEEEENQEMDCVKDAFSFIMVNPWSFPAFTGWFIYLVQISSYFLSIQQNFERNKDPEFAEDPPFRLPVGVGPFVHTSQGISIFLMVLVQESLWEAVADLSNGYNEHLKSQDIQFIWWLLPNLLRASASVVAIFVTFILVITSDNTVDLFKDFTAMLFVSSFDNLLYILAQLNIIGRFFKRTADKADSVTYKFTHTLILSKRDRHPKKSRWYELFLLLRLHRPYTMSFILYCVAYYMWFRLILLPHRNGTYLCQEMVVQIDDGVNPEMSFFTGTYKLLKGDKKRGIYPGYVEDKKSVENFPDRKPMIIRYCDSLGYWAFTLEETNGIDECNEDNVLVRSTEAENQEQYNIFEMPEDEWKVKYEDGRFMPTDDVFILCLDRRPEYMNLDYSAVCQDVEVDERYDRFESSRSWSSNFSALRHEMETSKMVTVYFHLVYVSSDMQELLFFTGKRWILTYIQDLADFNDNGDLGLYLENEFHGMWSNYKASFISGPITANTPDDTAEPISVGWYEATKELDNQTQIANPKRESTTSLLCRKCNNETNPCYYSGICVDDNTCKCSNGSSGTLCQVSPGMNGLCDPFFNKNEFDYDGGDCCINTCKSKEYTCGIDASGSFYVGYERCLSNSKCADCMHATELSPSLKSLVITHVSITECGRSLVLIDSKSQSVLVYDNVGSIWHLRGTPVATSQNPASDSVQISGYKDAMNNGAILTPVTVALISGVDIRIYDWVNDSNSWVKKSSSFNMTEVVKEFQLCNSGKSLGVMGMGGYFGLFRRGDFSLAWREVKKLTNQTYISFSMSTNGKVIALATANQTIEIHKESDVMFSKSFMREVKIVKLSSEGQVLTVLSENTAKNGEVCTYNVTDNTFVDMGMTLRGVSTVDAKIEITNDGLMINTYSAENNEINFYRWRDGRWQHYFDLIGKSPSFSDDKSTLAVASFNPTTSLGSSGAIEIHNRNINNCERGTAAAYFTFIPDNAPGELTWEIFVITSTGEFISLKQGGPYDVAGSMFVEKLCIDDTLLSSSNEIESDRCLGIQIIDKGLDGLRNPGMAGLSQNGEVKWSENATNGYKSIFPIHGNRTHLDRLITKSPWSKIYDPFLYIECLSTSCEWRKIGAVDYKHEKQNTERFMEISSDGTIFVLGNRDTEDVHIFKYTITGAWIQYGSSITNDQNGSGFGRFVSLSSDGSTIAIGAPLYSSNKNGIGQVRVYQYNHTDDKWSQLGNDFNSEEKTTFNSHLSLSADGTVLAIGAEGQSKSACNSYIYSYDVRINEWTQRGNCLRSVSDPSRVNVRLSGTGEVVAVASYDYAYVQIFKFHEAENLWYQQGSIIQSDDVFFGRQLSLSSDGSVFAAAFRSIDPVQVFQFNSGTNEWERKGQLITSNRGVTFDIALSSNGSILVVTYENVIETFMYDEFNNIWVESLITIPETNYTKSSPRLAVSADALVIAAEEDNFVSFYRLFRKGASQCREDENFFNFTIKPDQFPQDVIWYAKGVKGNPLLGGRLPANTGNSKESRGLTYQKCFPKHESTVVTFTITDNYGDGICCQWGNGTFRVEWNSEVALDSANFNFLTEEVVCIPRSANASVYSIEIESNPEKEPISWILFDSTYSETLMEGSTSDHRSIFKQCLPSLECMILAMFDPSGNGSPYTVRKNDNILYQRNDNETFNFNRVPIGNCNATQCSDGHSLFELDIGTDEAPYDLHWQLFDSNYTILASREPRYYKNRNKYHYVQECVPTNDCLTLKLFDAFPSRNTTFLVTYDGLTIKEGRGLVDYMTTIKMGKCDVPRCSQDYVSFELEISTQNEPEHFTWQLLSANNSIMMSDGENYLPFSFYHVRQCVYVLQGSCATLSFFDTQIGNDEVIAITWDDRVIENGLQLSTTKKDVRMCN